MALLPAHAVRRRTGRRRGRRRFRRLLGGLALRARPHGVPRQAVFVDPIADRVAGETELRRGARDVPVGLLKRLEQFVPLSVGLLERVLAGDLRSGPRARRPGSGKPEDLFRHEARLRQQRNSLNHIGELSHVAWPVVRE